MKQILLLVFSILISVSLAAQNDSTKIKVLNKNIVTVVDGIHSTKVKVGNERGVEVITDEFGDTTKIRIGKHVFNVVENHDGSHLRVTKIDIKEKSWRSSMNAHWAGFELGFNMFHNPNYSLYGMPPAYGEFMDLHQAKSLTFNFNFLEFVFSNRQKNFGLVTGMGLNSMNFRFDQPVTIIKENGRIIPLDISSYESLNKSKLNVTYLTVPLLLELKTPLRFNSAHVYIAGGVIGGLNIGSHTKIKYKSNKVKERGNFYLNEFKYELTGRIGFGDFCFFANYSMVPLFKDQKGPELHPFTIGFSFPNM